MTAGEVGHRLSELQKESDAASEVVMEKFLLTIRLELCKVLIARSSERKVAEPEAILDRHYRWIIGKS